MEKYKPFLLSDRHFAKKMAAAFREMIADSASTAPAATHLRLLTRVARAIRKDIVSSGDSMEWAREAGRRHTELVRAGRVSIQNQDHFLGTFADLYVEAAQKAGGRKAMYTALGQLGGAVAASVMESDPAPSKCSA